MRNVPPEYAFDRLAVVLILNGAEINLEPHVRDQKAEQHLAPICEDQFACIAPLKEHTDQLALFSVADKHRIVTIAHW